MGHYFIEPSDHHNASIRKVLCFIGSVGLIEGSLRKGSTTDLGGHSGRAG
jgi:hypothetical protein